MKKSIVVSLVLAGAVVLAATIIAKPWITFRQAKPITVKGYAETEVVSDSGSLTVSVTAQGISNSVAYTASGKSLENVKDVVRSFLGDSPDMVEMNTSIKAVHKRDSNGKPANEIDHYVVTRTLRVNSTDVRALEKLGRALFDLNAKGIRVSVRGPEFFISNLDSVKLKLIEEATRNGKERAVLMAESSGARLGNLVSARQGVIQITKRNSSDMASWGVYDTETIDKVVKLVVTLEYEITE